MVKKIRICHGQKIRICPGQKIRICHGQKGQKKEFVMWISSTCSDIVVHFLKFIFHNWFCPGTHQKYLAKHIRPIDYLEQKKLGNLEVFYPSNKMLQQMCLIDYNSQIYGF